MARSAAPLLRAPDLCVDTVAAGWNLLAPTLRLAIGIEHTDHLATIMAGKPLEEWRGGWHVVHGATPQRQ